MTVEGRHGEFPWDREKFREETQVKVISNSEQEWGGPNVTNGV